MSRSAALAPLAVALALAAAPTAAQAAEAPKVDATWVTDVTATSATLHAEADPEGLPSTYRFEYETEAAYEANLGTGEEAFAGAARAPSAGEAGLGEEAVDQVALQHLERLSAGTAYRYRIVATNSAGSTPGPARAFATQSNLPSGPEACTNAGLRIEDRSTALPDCRAWELVSPAEKNGGAVQGFGQNFGGDVLQAAAGGEAATFSSSASFGAEAQGAPLASQYISRRSEAGWLTENVTAPTLSGAYGAHPDGVPYQLFSPELDRGLLLNGRRCGEGEQCPRGYSLRESAGGALTPSPEAPDLRLAGASPDLHHVILSTCAALTPEATEVPSVGGGCDPSAPNLYEWSGAVPQLINILPGESHGTPGTRLAAQTGAVSSDGSRVYFGQIEDGALYLREDGAPTKLLPETVGGGASFQTASADGSLAFFIKAGHLYRYDAATEVASDLTPAGEVLGVLGAAADGSRVYYQTASGLFLWDEGTTTEVAPGADAAEPGDYPPATGTARVGADGTQLAFLSKAQLTGYDNTDQQSGELDSEVYHYSAPSGGGEVTLLCASCNPTGERPLGPSAIPGAIANGASATATDIYKPRDLSTNGRRLFFDSADRILPRDTSAVADVYEWEAGGEGSCARPAGCVFLISSGASSQASQFIDASADGRDALFLSADSLSPFDPGSVDLYDARALGGFSVPTPPIPCEGDACQAVPSPPEDPSPGTLVSGQGNPPVRFPKPRCPKGKHRVRRHGHSHCVPKSHKRRGST
jgi:hypothetical protein